MSVAATSGPGVAQTADPSRAPGLPARWAVFLVVAAVLCGLVPVLLLQQVEDAGRSGAWGLTLALMVWAGIRIAHRVADGRPALFDFVFWLFVYIFLGLAPTAQIRADQVSTTTPGMDPVLDSRVATTVWTGVLCYEAGRFVARHLRRPPGVAPKAVRLDVVPGRAVVLTVVGILAAGYYIMKIGPSTLFLSRYAAYDIRSQRMPDVALRSMLAGAGSYPLLIAAGVYLRVWVTRVLGPSSARYLPLLVPTVAVLLVVVNPISSARYDFGTVAFALVVLVGAVGTRHRARLTMAGTVAAFLFVFPIADAFRTDRVNTTRNGFFGEYLANADYDAFWQIGNALSYVGDGLVRPLRQALGVVLFWVPRGSWPDKPVDTGILLADYRGYSFTNLSAPLWAELLVNGGIALLVLGFVGLGIALGRLDLRIVRALLGGGQLWAIVGAVFPVYMVILLRGSLLQATGTLAVAVACVLYVRRSKRATAPPGTVARSGSSATQADERAAGDAPTSPT